ncbi:MAG: class II glutamine amidotransferase [Oscillibacter sp.]
MLDRKLPDSRALIASEARGTDATGIAYNTSRGLQVYKRPLAAHRLHLRIPAEARAVMGHTRMTTQGSAKKNYNNHPFFGHVKEESFALAHNGVLWNDSELRHTQNICREQRGCKRAVTSPVRIS